jgi:hypothetical protein
MSVRVPLLLFSLTALLFLRMSKGLAPAVLSLLLRGRVADHGCQPVSVWINFFPPPAQAAGANFLGRKCRFRFLGKAWENSLQFPVFGIQFVFWFELIKLG